MHDLGHAIDEPRLEKSPNRVTNYTASNSRIQLCRDPRKRAEGCAHPPPLRHRCGKDYEEDTHEADHGHLLERASGNDAEVSASPTPETVTSLAQGRA